jgi:septal ring factor EnvC (AmiA/AmiB activator)
LKKFRRQLTIEEQQQIGGEESSAVEPAKIIVDEELDDIDKLRDDLQATKQLLEIELKNKHVEQELNEKLQSKLKQMEEEMKTMKNSLKQAEKQNQHLSEQLEAAKRRDSVENKVNVPYKMIPLETSFSFADLKRDLSMANLTRNDSVIFNEIDAFEEEYNSLQVSICEYRADGSKIH